MNPTDEHVRRFLVRYGEALAAGDLKTISDSYAVPALVLSDAGSVPIATRQEIEAAFDGAAERYRAQGLVGIRPTLLAWEALGERLLFLEMRWDYLDEQGRSAQQNDYRYVLRLENEATLKIQVVIATSWSKRASENLTSGHLREGEQGAGLRWPAPCSKGHQVGLWKLQDPKASPVLCLSSNGLPYRKHPLPNRCSSG